VVVGGLALSTLITLVLTPLVFSFAIEAVTRLKSLLGMEPVAVSDQSEPAYEGNK
jgi:hypothetical protein